MTYLEIIALTPGQLDDAITSLLGEKSGIGNIGIGDFKIKSRWMPNTYWTQEVLELIEMFHVSITCKKDPTKESKWLASTELPKEGKLWEGYGPTIGVAVCRAILLNHYHEKLGGEQFYKGV